jgi:hypothetical protein
MRSLRSVTTPVPIEECVSVTYTTVIECVYGRERERERENMGVGCTLLSCVCVCEREYGRRMYPSLVQIKQKKQ